MKNVELIEKAIELLEGGMMKGNEDVISELLVKYVMCNTTIKKFKNLSVKDIPKRPHPRPVYCNVVYMDSENKVAVGTDGFFMFVNPKEYTEEYGKNVVIDYKNKLVEARYPKYRGLLPKMPWDEFSFGDASELVEKAKRSIAISLLDNDFCGEPYIKIGVAKISTKSVPYIIALGTDGWQYQGDVFYKKTSDGREFLFKGVELNN